MAPVGAVLLFYPSNGLGSLDVERLGRDRQRERDQKGQCESGRSQLERLPGRSQRVTKRVNTTSYWQVQKTRQTETQDSDRTGSTGGLPARTDKNFQVQLAKIDQLFN